MNLPIQYTRIRTQQKNKIMLTSSLAGASGLKDLASAEILPRNTTPVRIFYSLLNYTNQEEVW